MTIEPLEQLIAALPPVALAELNRRAALQPRKDRKYLVSSDQLAEALGRVGESVAALDIEGRRWFNYESLYFDTDDLASYRLAATRRPSRFKVRTRSYLDSGSTLVELKTKDRRGRTVKHRRPYEGSAGTLIEEARRHAADFEESAAYASHLRPVLTSAYERSTILLPQSGVRATIDRLFRATLTDGRQTGLNDALIVETKTNGRPSVLDRVLWRSGIRPVKISKYATGLASLYPQLPSNRWHRVIGLLTPQLHPAGSAPRPLSQ